MIPFDDVDNDTWYTEAVRWAASKKIVEGYGDGNFGVNDAITREQLVTILYRYAQYKGYDVSVGENTNILSYDDSFSISEYAYPALQWACGAGIISGDDGSLLPQNNATRSQVAVILQRFNDLDTNLSLIHILGTIFHPLVYIMGKIEKRVLMA